MCRIPPEAQSDAYCTCHPCSTPLPPLHTVIIGEVVALIETICLLNNLQTLLIHLSLKIIIIWCFVGQINYYVHWYKTLLIYQLLISIYTIFSKFG